jgi:hypothetical protein
MSSLLIQYIYEIDEEDLLIDEPELNLIEPKNRNINIKIFPGEYIDSKIELVFFDTKENLSKELEIRVKNNNKYLPIILGKSINNSLLLDNFYNNCLIFEKGNLENLQILLKNKELKIQEILELIKQLINLFDFFNSRNLFLGTLSLSDLFYDKNTFELKVFKFPLAFIDNNINTEDDLLKRFEKENLILLAPEIIRNFKSNKNKNKISLNNNNINNNNINFIDNNYFIDNYTDSWNLGILIFEILEGKSLFEISEFSKEFILEIIANIDNDTITKKINSINFNQNFKNLLKKLLKVDRKNRLCTKLVKQSFLKRIVYTKSEERDIIYSNNNNKEFIHNSNFNNNLRNSESKINK